MFLNQNRLPHLLSPKLYSCHKQYEREIETLFKPGWHVVAGAEQLARPGDFITIELFGVPVIVRNFDGEIHAFLNVCTHRHCTLTKENCGNHPQLVCQYHGWEYLADGTTGRIPDAGSFRPMPGGPERLQQFAVEVRGPLVFVSISPTPSPLQDIFKPLEEPCNEFPIERWKLADAWDYEFRANWKIPVENTVESYHVPIIHPNSLINYAKEEQITHEIHPQVTVMRTPTSPPDFYRQISKWILPLMDRSCTVDQYRLFHALPNLFLIRVDAMLQVMVVYPLSPTTCRMTVRVYALRAERRTLLNRSVTWAWGKFKARIVRWVLSEDAHLYPEMQKGMESSPFQGTISMREELVFAFQEFVRRGTQPLAPPANKDSTSADNTPDFTSASEPPSLIK